MRCSFRRHGEERMFAWGMIMYDFPESRLAGSPVSSKRVLISGSLSFGTIVLGSRGTIFLDKRSLKNIVKDQTGAIHRDIWYFYGSPQFNINYLPGHVWYIYAVMSYHYCPSLLWLEACTSRRSQHNFMPFVGRDVSARVWSLSVCISR